METAITEPSLELSQLKLETFWKNLPQELQKEIGIRVSLLMCWSAFTLDFFEILRSQGLTQMPNDTELSSIIDEIRTLDSVSQGKIRHQLVNYFISRNS